MATSGIFLKTVNNLSEIDKFPIRAIGPKGPNSFLGGQEVFFQGATGLVATTFGIPGVTIGRLATGRYGVVHPPIKHAQILPHIQHPTGHGYSVQIAGRDGAQYDGQSGYAEVHITRQEMAPVVTGTTPSMRVVPQNPPTGAKLDLFLYGSTVSPLGY
jgi:hypothetical protein